MRSLSNYIIKQIFVGYVLVTLGLMIILWLTQSLKFIEMVLSKGLPLTVFLRLTLLLMPQFFVVLSPIALFIATLFTYNRLITDRELVVMQAAGIGPKMLSKPAIILGLIATLFGYIMNIYIAPQASRDFRALEWKVKNDVSHLMFKEGEFTNLPNKITVFINKHEDDGSISGLMVNDERKPDIKVTFTAEKGRIIYTNIGPKIIMVNGTRQEINNKTNQYSHLEFKRYAVDFGNFKSKKNTRIPKARERDLSELFTLTEKDGIPKKLISRYKVEAHKRLTNPVYNLIYVLVAIIGLLVSAFNRRGQNKIVSLTVLAMIILQSIQLSGYSIVKNNISLIPVIYLNTIIPIVLGYYLLINITPYKLNQLQKRFSRSKKNEK
jgi:lipopolysaccharide export system permease protein